MLWREVWGSCGAGRVARRPAPPPWLLLVLLVLLRGQGQLLRVACMGVPCGPHTSTRLWVVVVVAMEVWIPLLRLLLLLLLLLQQQVWGTRHVHARPHGHPPRPRRPPHPSPLLPLVWEVW